MPISIEWFELKGERAVVFADMHAHYCRAEPSTLKRDSFWVGATAEKANRKATAKGAAR